MEFDLSNVHVMLAMPTHREIPVATARSLLDTQSLMLRTGLPLSLNIQEGSSLVHHARNRAVKRFLESKCTHIFWVDSDIVWDAEDFKRLLAFSTKLECVCAAYPRKVDGAEFYLRYIDKQVIANAYGLVPIRGTGMGFCVVQRKVIEELATKAPLLKYSATPGAVMPAMFRSDDVEDGEARGEDYSFFADLIDLGYQVNLDPSITLGHVGSKVFRASVTECMG